MARQKNSKIIIKTLSLSVALLFLLAFFTFSRSFAHSIFFAWILPSESSLAVVLFDLIFSSTSLSILCVVGAVFFECDVLRFGIFFYIRLLAKIRCLHMYIYFDDDDDDEMYTPKKATNFSAMQTFRLKTNSVCFEKATEINVYTIQWIRRMMAINLMLQKIQQQLTTKEPR